MVAIPHSSGSNSRIPPSSPMCSIRALREQYGPTQRINYHMVPHTVQLRMRETMLKSYIIIRHSSVTSLRVSNTRIHYSLPAWSPPERGCGHLFLNSIATYVRCVRVLTFFLHGFRCQPTTHSVHFDNTKEFSLALLALTKNVKGLNMTPAHHTSLQSNEKFGRIVCAVSTSFTPPRTDLLLPRSSCYARTYVRSSCYARTYGNGSRVP